MSYTLTLYAISLEDLLRRFETAGITSAAEDRAQRTFDLIKELGEPVDAMSHGSAGGQWFREQFLDVAVARLIGTAAVGHLLRRPLAGVCWDYRPTFGWLTRAELTEAVARLDAADQDALADLDDPASEEALQELADMLRMCAMPGQDVITVYT